MVNPQIMNFLDSEGIILGYYSPGEVPVISYDLSREGTYLPSLISQHETAHEALYLCTSYGQFCITLNRIESILARQHVPKKERSHLHKCLNHLMRECLVTQEGYATFTELLGGVFKYDVDTLKSIKNALWYPYSLSLEVFDQIFKTMISSKDLANCPGWLVNLLMGALAGSVLNTDILNHFQDYRSISTKKILEYLDHPYNNPDRRLITLADEVGKKSTFFVPVLEKILSDISDEAVFLYQNRKTPTKEKLRLLLQIDLQVTDITREWLNKLNLFPIDSTMSTKPHVVHERVTDLVKGAIEAFDIKGGERYLSPLMMFTTGDLLKETHSYHHLKNRYILDKVSTLEELDNWLENFQHDSAPENCYCCFAGWHSSEEPQKDKESDVERFFVEIASLTLFSQEDGGPIHLRFDQQVIFVKDLTLKQLVSVRNKFEHQRVAFVFLANIMNSLNRNSREVLFSNTKVPIFLYTKTVDLREFERAMSYLERPIQARFCSDTTIAENILYMRSLRKRPNIYMLFFLTEIIADVYRKILLDEGIDVQEAKFNYKDNQDVTAILASWICSFGSLGVVE